MLAVVLNSDPEWAPSSWGVWIETIMTKKWILGIQQAALVRKNGSLAATSSDMGISTDEILVIILYFRHFSTVIYIDLLLFWLIWRTG